MSNYGIHFETCLKWGNETQLFPHKIKKGNKKSKDFTRKCYTHKKQRKKKKEMDFVIE